MSTDYSKAPVSTGEKKPGALRIHYGPDQYEFGDLRLPDGAGPHRTVILVHGGVWRPAWHLDLSDLLAEDLRTRGYASWNIEYRRNNQPGGGWPGTFHDISDAADYLLTLSRQYHLDTSKETAMGHSAGGQLALWLAGRHRLPGDSELRTGREQLSLACVVSQSGASDLRLFVDLVPGFSGDVATLLGGAAAEMPARWSDASPVDLLPLGVPQIMIHGQNDKVVPIEISREYAAAAREAGDHVEVLEFPDAGHFEVLYPQLAPWELTMAAVERIIGGD